MCEIDKSNLVLACVCVCKRISQILKYFLFCVRFFFIVRFHITRAHYINPLNYIGASLRTEKKSAIFFLTILFDKAVLHRFYLGGFSRYVKGACAVVPGNYVHSRSSSSSSNSTTKRCDRPIKHTFRSFFFFFFVNTVSVSYIFYLFIFCVV